MTAGATPPLLYLIDTSVWIFTLRQSARDTPLLQRVDALLASNTAATTGMVRLELLQGARDQRQYDRLTRLFAGLHQLPSDEPTWEDAARLAFRLRRAGFPMQSTDLIIAAVAIRFGATVLHRDRDFDAIAQHAPLLVESHA